MHVRVARIALTFAITAGALIFGGCANPGHRISEHPEMYQSLPPRDQALVSQGQIRPGMTMDAVWLAWGRRTDAGIEVRARHTLFAGDREAVRRQTVATALEGLLLDD